MHAHRLAAQVITDPDVTKRLFDEVAPRLPNGPAATPGCASSAPARAMAPRWLSWSWWTGRRAGEEGVRRQTPWVNRRLSATSDPWRFTAQTQWMTTRHLSMSVPPLPMMGPIFSVFNGRRKDGPCRECWKQLWLR